MSILAKIQQQNAAPVGKKLFAILAGQRLSGKSTLAGTLQGKTLMLQAAVLESGSDSAKALAKQNKNDLVIYAFETVAELKSIIAELNSDTVFDNVFIDSLSAVTDMKYAEPSTAVMIKRNVWDGFRCIGEDATEIIIKLKELTYPTKTKKAKNVFLVCALDMKLDNSGNPAEVSLTTKGNMAVSSVTKYGEAVLTAVIVIGDKGAERKLLTKTQGLLPARIDGILDQQNPGIIAPDLNEVLKLISSTK